MLRESTVDNVLLDYIKKNDQSIAEEKKKISILLFQLAPDYY